MSKTIYNTFNKKEVLDLYLKQRLPLSKIAIKFKVSHKTMKRFFDENGINIFGRISSNKFLADKDWLADQYLNKKKSIQNIANLVEATRGNVHSALKWSGVPIRGISEGINASNPNRFGANAGHWKGGRVSGGRYEQIYSRLHPMANHDGYVLEHRLIMEKKLGRYLTKDEIVHHLDGDGHNNKLSNLKLTTRKKHFQDHFDAVKEVGRLKKILDKNKIAY